MYHISSDRRAVRSAERIVLGLEELLRNTAVQDIAVSTLCRRCGIGRATFYRLFDNLTDVLAYRCDQILDEAARRVREDPEMTAAQSCLFVLREWMEQPALMKAIMEGQHLEILYRSMVRHMDLLRSRFEKTGISDGPFLEFQAMHLCLLIPTCLFIWHRNGCRQSAEELFGQFSQSIRLMAESL